MNEVCVRIKNKEKKFRSGSDWIQMVAIQSQVFEGACKHNYDCVVLNANETLAKFYTPHQSVDLHRTSGSDFEVEFYKYSICNFFHINVK